MMDLLLEILGFASKGLVVFITIAACAVIIVGLMRSSRRGAIRGGRLEVRKLNEVMRGVAETLHAALMPAKDYKRRSKALAKAEKKRQRPSRNVFVLDFKGDIMATAVESLREEVSALLAVAGDQDEVVVRLDSPGGTVPNYGLAASQLARLRERGLKLTVCVDKVAASGGYMMACVAEEIIAAPFAIVGSIGVVAPLPNVHRLLERYGVDYENMTAGKYKRTVSFLAENDAEGRRKYQEQLDDTHDLFKDFVQQNRPKLDMDQVATGEYWHATRAADLGLVDRLMTSDDYLMSKLDSTNLLQVTFRHHRGVRDRLAGASSRVATAVADAFWARLREVPQA
jgi:serine protease SohB